MANIENNLGVIAMEIDTPDIAEAHFGEALTKYQSKSNRSSNVTSDINLLFVFLIQDQQLNYRRLSPSMTRLTEVFPNVTRQNTLFWLNTVFQIRQGLVLNEQIKTQLEDSFYKINDSKLQFSLKKHFAKELNVNVPLPIKIPQQQSIPLWFNEINQCDWEQLKKHKI